MPEPTDVKVRDITDGQIIRMVAMVRKTLTNTEQFDMEAITFTDTQSLIASVRRFLSTREEGDAAGEEETGQLWRFTTSGGRPDITRGERVYIVCEDRIRGYAPLAYLDCEGGRVHLIRGSGAVAVTIPEKVVDFRGWRFRWWSRADEIPFPDWKTADRRHRQRNLF